MTTSARAETEVPISPEQYWEILKGLSLESINLIEWSARIDYELWLSQTSQRVPIHLDLQQEMTAWEQRDSGVTFLHTYRLVGKTKRRQVLRIEAVYRVHYHAKQVVPVEFVTIFRQSTLVLTTYPYFRELTDSTTRRMGVPPLTLPMVLIQ